jgi:hypothetical protein
MSRKLPKDGCKCSSCTKWFFIRPDQWGYPGRCFFEPIVGTRRGNTIFNRFYQSKHKRHEALPRGASRGPEAY